MSTTQRPTVTLTLTERAGHEVKKFLAEEKVPEAPGAVADPAARRPVEPRMEPPGGAPEAALADPLQEPEAGRHRETLTSPSSRETECG